MATKEVKTKKKFYKVLKPIEMNQKCPPQSKLIVDTVVGAGGRISRDELLDLLKRPPAEGGLTTDQTAERILSFYRPRLRDSGTMVEEIEETTETVEVPDEPAAEPAAEKPAKAAKAPKSGKGKKGTPVESGAEEPVSVEIGA